MFNQVSIVKFFSVSIDAMFSSQRSYVHTIIRTAWFIAAVSTKTCFAALHRLRDWLQDSLVVRRSQRCSATPTHLLQHRSPTIVGTQFWRRSTNNLAISIRRSGVVGPGWRRRTLRSLALDIQSREISPVDAVDSLVECRFYVGQCPERSV